MNAFQTVLNSQTISCLAWALLHSLWQGGLIALFLFVALRLFKSSQTRYLAACGALIMQAVLFFATFVIVDGKRVIPSASSVSLSPSMPGLNMGEMLLVAPQASAESTFYFQTSLSWLAALYIAGVVAMSFYNIGGWVAIQRLRLLSANLMAEQWQPRLRRLMAQMQISQPVRLIQSTWAQTPMVLGFFKPVILIPAALLTQLPVAQMEAILLHELAHIRRHDYLMNLLQTVFDILFFYHPAAWWISSRIRTERENCCDDMVIAITENRAIYAEALACVAKSSTPLAMAASGGSLVGRIRRILGGPGDFIGAGWQKLTGTFVALGVLGLMTCLYGTLHAALDKPENFQEEAMAALKKNRSGDEVGIIISKWMKVDPAGAKVWASSLPNFYDRMKAVDELVKTWVQQDPQAAAYWTWQLGSKSIRETETALAVTKWTARDQKAAMEWTMHLADDSLRDSASGAMASEWCTHDPNAAIKWAQQLPEGKMKTYALSRIVQRLPEKDPALAIQLAEQLPPGNDQLFAIYGLAGQWVDSHPEAAEAAMQWALSLPEGDKQKFAVQGVVTFWTFKNRKVAMKWAGNLPQGKLRDQVFREIVSTWSQAQPDAAAKWATEFLSGDVKKEALRYVGSNWGLKDPKTAMQWAQQQPEEAFRNEMLTYIAGGWSYKNSEAALQWALQMPAGELRDKILEQINESSRMAQMIQN